jgi:hypothetical protein
MEFQQEGRECATIILSVSYVTIWCAAAAAVCAVRNAQGRDYITTILIVPKPCTGEPNLAQWPHVKNRGPLHFLGGTSSPTIKLLAAKRGVARARAAASPSPRPPTRRLGVQLHRRPTIHMPTLFLNTHSE